MKIKYTHTNLIAKDWQTLSQFYIAVFHCKPLYPERDLEGEWLDRLTGQKDAKIRGIHLALPGWNQGPTLEIFEYEPGLDKPTSKINTPGFGHIAFHVDDVEAIIAKLVEHGGKTLGKVIRKDLKGLGLLTAVYAQDPEGNFIEIQNWSKD